MDDVDFFFYVLQQVFLCTIGILVIVGVFYGKWWLAYRYLMTDEQKETFLECITFMKKWLRWLCFLPAK